MRLTSYRIDERDSWGVVGDDSVSDLGGGGRFPTLKDYLRDPDPTVLAAEAPRHALREIAWLPVIPNPDKILCVGLNYEAHRVETGRERTAHPAFFTRFADTQVGHGAPIVRPKVSDQLDYEGELAVIIGRAGRYIPADRAVDHIAGYAIYQDASVRDWQRHTAQFTPGKNFPGTAGFGPWMVTPDELGDLTERRIETQLNNVVMQSATFGQMIHNVAQIIAYCSTFTDLRPGDVIATGTPGGVGMKRDPQVFMKAGDEIAVRIEGIGTLVNRIIDED